MTLVYLSNSNTLYYYPRVSQLMDRKGFGKKGRKSPGWEFLIDIEQKFRFNGGGKPKKLLKNYDSLKIHWLWNNAKVSSIICIKISGRFEAFNYSGSIGRIDPANADFHCFHFLSKPFAAALIVAAELPQNLLEQREQAGKKWLETKNSGLNVTNFSGAWHRVRETER